MDINARVHTSISSGPNPYLIWFEWPKERDAVCVAEASHVEILLPPLITLLSILNTLHLGSQASAVLRWGLHRTYFIRKMFRSSASHLLVLVIIRTHDYILYHKKLKRLRVKCLFQAYSSLKSRELELRSICVGISRSRLQNVSSARH
jgi:hypothetical protein